MSDLWRKPAHELAALVRKREISPVELLDAHLAVIDRLNPTLNAIVTSTAIVLVPIEYSGIMHAATRFASSLRKPP